MAAKSIIRWAGSKRQLLPHLRLRANIKFERYIEPFMGSACLFVTLSPKKAILNDLNSDLVRTFKTLKKDSRGVCARLKTLKKSKSIYCRLRRLNPSKLGSISAAARFIYLNRFCFNGIYRTNLRGQFNVPYAPTKTGKRPSQKEIITFSDSLKGARLLSGDFLKATKHARRNDLVYLDPPYASSKRRIFREYDEKSFSVEDLKRLTVELRRLSRIGARFIVSYADCPEGRKLLKPWKPVRIRTRRNIAGFTSDRKNAFELLATNFKWDLPTEENDARVQFGKHRTN